MALTAKDSTRIESRNLIGGQWVAADGPVIADLFDPASGQRTGAFRAASLAQLDSAVSAARAVLENGWNATTVQERAAYLSAVLSKVRENANRLALCISAEIGAPIDFCHAQQVGTAINHLAATLEASKHHHDDVTPVPEQTGHRERRVPIGVAGMITPWNWPVNQIALKFGAALIAGCPMVLKPSELSSRSAVLFAECVHAAGLPAGVFNLVLGGGEVGAALASHPDVAIISFTGSNGVGRQIAVAAARDFRRCILELGGKSPNLLFDDCDPALAVRQGVAHCFRNGGQSCNAASLMLVQRGIYDRVVQLAADEANATPPGMPWEAGTHLGPVISQQQWERVQGIIQTAIEQGARLVAGGLGKPQGFNDGYFVEPTVFADVTPDMDIAHTEVFGPVLSIMRFDTEEQAVALANSSPFGLAGYVQTSDAARASRVAEALKVGMVQVNGTSRLPGAPFGGVKASGIGRESGIWGIRAYTEITSISGAAKTA